MPRETGPHVKHVNSRPEQSCNRMGLRVLMCSVRHPKEGGFAVAQGTHMSEIEELEQKVESLSPEDHAKFRAWFLEHDWELWDQQIEADLTSGRLDDLISEARADFEAGKTREL